MDILKDLEIPSHPDLLQSFEHGADAAIYKLDDKRALVFTADFFTPVVDNPYTFGQIAATNALSDIYVCGGKPILALNLICFPRKNLPKEILKEILRGGFSKIKEAGALLVGGHSIEDQEPKYGLAVIGIADPNHIISNKNAKSGDLLYLTKPIGTGILITAYKGRLFKENSELYLKMIESMTRLIDKEAEIMLELKITAATDVTGFGLLGHALEMANASKKDLVIYTSKVPIFEEARDFVSMGIIPEGDHHNLNFCKKFIKIDSQVPEDMIILLCDAQTSGGVLVAVPEEKKEEFEKKMLEKGLNFIEPIGEVKLPEDSCPKVLLVP